METPFEPDHVFEVDSLEYFPESETYDGLSQLLYLKIIHSILAVSNLLKWMETDMDIQDLMLISPT